MSASERASVRDVASGRIDPERPIQTHLGRVVLTIARGKRTGAVKLTFADASEQMQLVFVDGQIVYAEAESDAARVLELLVERGVLERDRARAIERRAVEERGWSGIERATELAVTEAAVRPDEAVAVVSEVVRARVATAFRTLEGEWRYADDARASGVPRYPVPFERTLLEALEHPECAPKMAAALARYAQYYPRFEGDRTAMTTLFGMTPARFRTLRLLDGSHTLADVLAASPLGREGASGLVAGLTILEQIGWSATPRPRDPAGGETALASPRAVTIERAPTSLSALRAPEPASSAVPTSASRPVTHARAPTPTPPSSGAKPLSPAEVAQLLKLGPKTAGASTAVSSRVAPHQPTESLSPQEFFERGRRHLAEGRLAPAHSDFQRALAGAPEASDIRLHAAYTSFLQASDPAERKRLGVELVRLAAAHLREHEGDPLAYRAVGRVAFEQGDDERALKAFRAALRADPGDVDSQRYLRVLEARARAPKKK